LTELLIEVDEGQTAADEEGTGPAMGVFGRMKRFDGWRGRLSRCFVERTGFAGVVEDSLGVGLTTGTVTGSPNLP
jgi:hypothetical protein